MKKGLLFLIALLLPLVAEATLIEGHNIINGTAMQGYELIAKRSCTNMSCIQQNLQVIDSQIADLLARRLAFVKRGAELKNSVVVADDNQVDPNVIRNVTRQAQFQGYPPEIAQAVFREINAQSQAYEQRYAGLNPVARPQTSSIPTSDRGINPVITPSITHGAQVRY